MAEKPEYSIKSSGTAFLLVDEDIHIDPTKANRSINVTGIPKGTKAEDLVIHFQRSKNGGSDVDEIVMNNQGSAVITFDKAEGTNLKRESSPLFNFFAFECAHYLLCVNRRSE